MDLVNVRHKERTREIIKKRKQARDAALFKKELERINKEHGYG